MTPLREIAALVGAAGVLLLLLPIGGAARAAARQALGLALTGVSWVALALSLAATGSVGSRIATPLGAVALVVAAALVVALVAGGARLILARPWIWFVALAVTLPVRTPVVFGGSTRNLLIPLYAVIAVGLAAWFWARWRGRLPAGPETAPVLGVPIAVYVGFSLVSTLWTHTSEEAAVKVVFFYIPFVILYLLVIAWWRHAPALRALCLTTALGGVGVALLALFQYATRTIFWNARQQQANVYGRFFRVNSIFYDPNILGRFLVLGILGAAAYAAWRRTPRVLITMGALALLETAALATTFSRSSCLQLMVGLAMISARAFSPRRVAAVAASVVVIGGLGAAAGSANVRRALTSTNQLSHVSEGRFSLAKGGLEIWKEAPVAGVGLGSFETYYAEQLTPSQRRKIRVVISHNAPITALSELGIVGFAALLWLLGWTGSVLRRRSTGRGAEGWAAWTGYAMLVGIFVHSLFYSDLFEDPYLWTIAAGAVALLATPELLAGSATAPARRPLRAWLRPRATVSARRAGALGQEP